MKSIRLLFILGVLHFTLVVHWPGQEDDEALRIYDQIKNASLDEEKVADKYVVSCQIS